MTLCNHIEGWVSSHEYLCTTFRLLSGKNLYSSAMIWNSGQKRFCWHGCWKEWPWHKSRIILRLRIYIKSESVRESLNSLEEMKIFLNFATQIAKITTSIPALTPSTVFHNWSDTNGKGLRSISFIEYINQVESLSFRKRSLGSANTSVFPASRNPNQLHEILKDPVAICCG